MKVLVIPDIHLKPFMFKQAAELMERGIAQRVVCLMDIPDDWDKQFNILFYEETYEEAIRFAKKYPDTAWCYGNHDLSYVWRELETGYSTMAAYTVQKKLLDLKEVLPENNPIKYVHRIDNVLFSHAGSAQPHRLRRARHPFESDSQRLQMRRSSPPWCGESPDGPV